MKTLKYTKFLTVLLVMIFITTSCEDDASEFVATETTPIILNELSISMIELDGTNLDNPAVTFNWSFADFSQPVVESYDVEFSTDNTFTNKVVATGAVGNNSATLSMNDLNSASALIGLPPFAWNTIYARVVASLGSQNSLPSNSNIISFEIYPFFNYAFDDYYLVGNGTSADWNNDNNNPALFRDATNDNIYSHTGFFTKGGGGFDDGRFKILENRGQWQPQWGTATDEGSDDITTNGEIAGNPGTQESDPGRFGVPADGYYTFVIDFGSNTYTTEPFNITGAADYTSMTLQGSGIVSDTPFTQSSFDSHLWYINSVTLIQGGLQILTNTGSTWAGTSEFSGVASEGGVGIPVVVGDEYEVWFSDLTGEYIMIPLNL